jgi:hypothetical protein
MEVAEDSNKFCRRRRGGRQIVDSYFVFAALRARRLPLNCGNRFELRLRL